MNPGRTPEPVSTRGRVAGFLSWYSHRIVLGVANHMIRAVTFDFWDTLAVDDSDEPKRAALGLPSKHEMRVQLFTEHILRHYPHISQRKAAAAYAWSIEQFQSNWHGEQRTPGVTTRLYDAYEYLGLLPKSGRIGSIAGEVYRLVREIEAMEIRIPPDFVSGAHRTLSLLSESYRLGIISDTIHTHGRGLRHLLTQAGLRQHFDCFIFSDEVGASKPSPDVFRRAIFDFEVPPHEIVHIGDRESNDVAGPLAMGMKSILFTGIVDRSNGSTAAHAVCRRFEQLPDILYRLR